ncbi:hypothetical protein ElyMa_000058900 [Elysia marginata]|uniref:Uncharacterized protein n=1 Tax=Elysia marginata TaxID=1093978 RepID=A0AAV4EG19_9GAST|nr:hypothetical protein ElyMa_000058900 [Elysia marginata]
MRTSSDQDSLSNNFGSKEDNLSAPVAPPRTKRKSPLPSPLASPLVSANRMRPNATSTPGTMAPQIPAPPRPLPRQSSLRSNQTQPADSRTSATVQDAPLIKFDSTESGTPDSDVFDPLASGKSKSLSGGEDSRNPISPSGLETLSPGEDEEDGRKFQRNRDSRSSLTRAKAFRREGQSVPLRPSYKDDSPEHSSATSTPKHKPGQDPFDPLCDLDGLSVSGKVPAVSTQQRDQQEAEERRRKSSQLLQHEWSMDTLASMSKGSSMTLPSNSSSVMRPRHQATNPFLVGSNQLTSQSPDGRYSLQAPQARSYQPHYSLAFAGSGPLPPPGRLPTSFLAPFTQTRSSVPMSSNSSSSSPFGSPARTMNQNSMPNPFTATSGRLLPAPTPSTPGSGMTRRTLPAAPGQTAGVSGSPGGSSGASSASAGKSQADLLSDLIGIDFGRGSQQATQPHQDKQQQQQPLSASQTQPQWETFE